MADSYNINSILGYQSITTAVQVTSQGLPDTIPERFLTLTEDVVQDSGSTINYYGQRKVAKAVPYGSAPKASDKLELSEVTFKCINFAESLPFQGELLKAFRDWDKWAVQPKFAKQQIEYQSDAFRQKFLNARIATVVSSLANGAMYFDEPGGGSLLPTSSGAALTVDQRIPAANKGTITDIDGNPIVTASWATSTTNIVEQIRNLQALSVKRTGKMPKYAFYGKNVAGYIAKNDFSKTYFPFAGNGDAALAIQLHGKIPAGFMDMEWIPMQTAFFEDATGTMVDQFPSDQITFFPEVEKDVYTLFEGSTLVPGSFGPMADSMAGLNSMKEVKGMGGFAYITPGYPPTLMSYYFDVFLPMFRNPRAVFLMDTTP